MMAVLLFVFGFGGGRALGISSAGSSGRLDTWSEQLPLLLSNPILGVGWNAVRSYTKHTSHNSFLLCAVELGFPGYFIWLGLVICTVLYLNLVLSETAQKPEFEGIYRTAYTVRLALFTYLTTSWFLSRTYVASLYVVLGISMAVYFWARREGALTLLVPRRNWIIATAAAMVMTLGSIYIQVRIRWLS
jgi:O-antigen ligase